MRLKIFVTSCHAFRKYRPVALLRQGLSNQRLRVAGCVTSSSVSSEKRLEATGRLADRPIELKYVDIIISLNSFVFLLPLRIVDLLERHMKTWIFKISFATNLVHNNVF